MWGSPAGQHRQDLALETAPSRAAVLLLVGLAMLPACTDDAPTTPLPDVGIIHGQVFDGAPPGDDELIVCAESVDAGVRRQVFATVAGDGTYSLAVPNGPVVVFLDRAPRIYHRDQGLTVLRSEADTVRVAGDAHRLDFACGRVHAEVGLAPALRSGWWRFRLHPESALDRTVAEGELEAAAVLAMDLRFVPPGRHVVTLHAEAFGDIYLPPTYDLENAEVIAVVAGGEGRHASAITDLAVIEGSVTGSWQVLGLDPPEVRAYVRPEDWVNTTTDPAGLFSLRLLAGGTCRLEVCIGGVGRWIGGDDFATATEFLVVPGETVSGVSHVESGLACVFSPMSLPPTYLYDVSLVDESGATLPVIVVHDQVQVANLKPGKVFLRLSTWVRRAIWLPQFWDRRAVLAEADPIVIPDSGGVARVTATLEKGGRILGRLRDADGHVPDPSRLFLLVHAAEDSAGILALYTSRDFESGLIDVATGDYVLTQLTNGRYRLRAHVGNDPWTWWPGRAAWDSAGVVAIEDLADVSGVDWQLRR